MTSFEDAVGNGYLTDGLTLFILPSSFPPSLRSLLPSFLSSDHHHLPTTKAQKPQSRPDPPRPNHARPRLGRNILSHSRVRRHAAVGQEGRGEECVGGGLGGLCGGVGWGWWCEWQGGYGWCRWRWWEGREGWRGRGGGGGDDEAVEGALGGLCGEWVREVCLSIFFYFLLFQSMAADSFIVIHFKHRLRRRTRMSAPTLTRARTY